MVESVTPGFHQKSFGQSLDDYRLIDRFRKDPKTKSCHVGAKRRSTLAAVKEWVKDRKPSQFWARWQSDSNHFKHDCVEIFYQE